MLAHLVGVGLITLQAVAVQQGPPPGTSLGGGGFGQSLAHAIYSRPRLLAAKLRAEQAEEDAREAARQAQEAADSLAQIQRASQRLDDLAQRNKERAATSSLAAALVKADAEKLRADLLESRVREAERFLAEKQAQQAFTQAARIEAEQSMQAVLALEAELFAEIARQDEEDIELLLLAS